MCFYLSYLLLGIPSQDPKGLKTRCSRTSLRRTRPRASGIGMRRWLNLAESARDSKSSQVTFGGSQMEGDQKAEDIAVVILKIKKTLNKYNFCEVCKEVGNSRMPQLTLYWAWRLLRYLVLSCHMILSSEHSWHGVQQWSNRVGTNYRLFLCYFFLLWERKFMQNVTQAAWMNIRI